MKLQRTLICIAAAFFAVGFTASQAAAGSGVPGCGLVPDGDGNGFMKLEINAIRAGAKTVVTGANQTTNVTAKARIVKGTADGATTMDAQLTIEAVTGGTVISTNSTGPIRLGVGKGGKGAKLSMAVPECAADGFIEFVATFFGVDAEDDACEISRPLRKACR